MIYIFLLRSSYVNQSLKPIKCLRIVSLVLIFNLFKGQLAWPNPLTKIHQHRADGGFGGLGNMGGFGIPSGLPAGGGGMSGLGNGGISNYMGASGSTGSESSTDECTQYKIIRSVLLHIYHIFIHFSRFILRFTRSRISAS